MMMDIVSRPSGSRSRNGKVEVVESLSPTDVELVADSPCIARVCPHDYRRVRLKGMSEDTDISILGENIVQKCGELIPDEWLPKVSS